jgi:hypothetical protein
MPEINRGGRGERRGKQDNLKMKKCRRDNSAGSSLSLLPLTGFLSLSVLSVLRG